MKAAPLLSIDNLTGGYGEIVIVTDLSLALSQGQALCVTGRNGVGKSTLARLVTGSLMPASGQVVFLGEDLTFAPAHGRARQGMGYAPQEGVVFDTLSVAENLTLHHRDRSLERYKELFAMFPRLPDRLGQRAGTLSGGEKKILSFCRALAEDTKLVILDEPTEGVQPENIALMAEAINRAKDAGRGFLIIEQNLSLVEAVADQAALMDHGECIYTHSGTINLRAELAERLKI
ncbi:ABC transporter ATP-binding protein [Hoeflea alexandrii]|uniref:ATP-binding cassette domain-containing protein n=2 Tax=Hoeflea alexandrii TaxID=288436 RepID=A0ABT1CWU5_9HYPH|nr:ATP-binding cassette domain-containing protein [Hoeflea alexandrii]MCO6410647.1 ATP-binding cassette domain-containing protein [Hoeflea alexandrii]